jgi:hypothetical protein
MLPFFILRGFILFILLFYIEDMHGVVFRTSHSISAIDIMKELV